MTAFPFARSLALAMATSLVATSCVETAIQPTEERSSLDPAPSGLSRISGKVLDSRGKPVAGALVRAFEDLADTVSGQSISDDDGTFQIEVRPGRVRLFLDKDGTWGAKAELERVVAGARLEMDTVRLDSLAEARLSLPGLSDASVQARLDASPLRVERDGSDQFRVRLPRGESVLSLSWGEGQAKQVRKLRVLCQGSRVQTQPVDSETPPPQVGDLETTRTLEIVPPSDEVAETEILGNFEGTSSWAGTNFGGRPEDGLGGAYDGNTIGRHLWRWRLPDSLRALDIRSVKLVFTPLEWNHRPTGGQDLTIEVHSLLRPWVEGAATGQGRSIGPEFDGATATGPSWGSGWSAPLAGLDGIDAQVRPIDRKTLPYLAKTPMAFDITETFRRWLADPGSNQGLLFRSVHEADGTYLDYPSFGTDDHPEVRSRPRLVLEVANQKPWAGETVLQPGPDGQDEAMIIGTFTGFGTHDGNNQGLRPLEALGGAWDANTVGRLLWRMPLPDSLRGREILSAKLRFTVAGWCGRPVQGHDYKVRAYEMLRDWKEGMGDFPGVANSPQVDGATSLGPRFGATWSHPLVALDGTDARGTPAAQSVLPFGSLGSMSFDLTELVRKWLADPSSNHGVVFRSLEEADPDYPDYPGFHTSEAESSDLRPALVVRWK